MTQLRDQIRTLVEHPLFERVVIAVIIANSITLGIETYPDLRGEYTQILFIIDKSFLVFFVIELLLRIRAYGMTFWRGGWNWFDFLIVTVSLLPFLGNLSALRALRILRTLRLLSVVPEFRQITEALVRAARGATAVFGVLALVLYVFAVMSSKLFGTTLPEYFGNLHLSFLTHFQLMIADNWSEVTRLLLNEVGTWTLWYVIGFTIVAGFVLVSMLIGVIIDAVQTVREEKR